MFKPATEVELFNRPGYKPNCCGSPKFKYVNPKSGMDWLWMKYSMVVCQNCSGKMIIDDIVNKNLSMIIVNADGAGEV